MTAVRRENRQTMTPHRHMGWIVALMLIQAAGWAGATSIVRQETVALGPTPQTRTDVYPLTASPDAPADARPGFLLATDLRRGGGSAVVRLPDGSREAEGTFGEGLGRFARVLDAGDGDGAGELDVSTELATGSYRVYLIDAPPPEGYWPLAAHGGVILAIGLVVLVAMSLRRPIPVAWVAAGVCVWVAGVVLHWVWTSRVDPLLLAWLADRLAPTSAAAARAVYAGIVAAVFQLGAMAALLPLLPACANPAARAKALAAGFVGAAFLLAGINLVADAAFIMKEGAGSDLAAAEVAIEFARTPGYLLAAILGRIPVLATLFVCVVLLHRGRNGRFRLAALAFILYAAHALLCALPEAFGDPLPQSAWWAATPLLIVMLPIAIYVYRRTAGADADAEASS